LSVAVIGVLPAVSPVARPVLSTLATLPAVEVHVAALLRSCVLLSVKVPVAVNCFVRPAAIDGFAGVTAIDAMTAGVTVADTVLLIEPSVAVIVTVPKATVATFPLPSMLAMVESEEFQITPLRSCVLPSVNRPTAVICSEVPNANDGAAGTNEMDTKEAGNTVNVVEPVTRPDVALMVTVPALSVVAAPALSMEATVESVEPHAADTSGCVVLLLKIPVATNG
jgi:hypothetical protein